MAMVATEAGPLLHRLDAMALKALVSSGRMLAYLGVARVAEHIVELIMLFAKLRSELILQLGDLDLSTMNSVIINSEQ